MESSQRQRLTSSLSYLLSLISFIFSLFPQAVWRTGACVVGWVLERVFGVDVWREGVSESGLYCDHLLENR